MQCRKKRGRVKPRRPGKEEKEEKGEIFGEKLFWGALWTSRIKRVKCHISELNTKTHTKLFMIDR